MEAEGKPGVWFVSLDAASTAAVIGARSLLRLPYFRARIALQAGASGVTFEARRRRLPAVEFRARYRASGEEFEPLAGTLEHFLMERYCLYTRWHHRRVLRLEIQHPPWQVSKATVEIEANTLASMQGIGLDPAEHPIAHFSRRQDTVAWRPVALSRQ